jgi:hypothetical protein
MGGKAEDAVDDESLHSYERFKGRILKPFMTEYLVVGTLTKM